MKEIISTATLAVMMLIVNIAGGQISNGLTEYQKQALQSKYIRWIAIFAIFYVGFGKLEVALGVSIGTIIILEYLLNENSRYYLFRRQENGIIKTIGSDALDILGF
jgi:hypothetical protein